MVALKTASADKRYTFAVGRRKTATASIKLFPHGKGVFTIVRGEKRIPLQEYFLGHPSFLQLALSPFTVLGGDLAQKYDADIRVGSGGKAGQADSIKLGFARALVESNPDFRPQLKPHELLKRDPRSKERKKPGLKKARKAPKWSKR
ncbi:MAG: 30S ribosomal protein S9 [bacterium]